MGYSKINVNNLFFFAICLCLVVFSINYKIFEFLRILDLIIIILFGLFFFLKPKINIIQFVIFLLITFVLILSTFLGIIKNGPIEIYRLVFIYKYLFIFLLPWLIVSVVNTEKQIRIINKLILVNFIFLSSWAWMYVGFKSMGFIGGNTRPSFPTENFHVSDAHLYSSYLGFFLSAYLLYLKNFFNHNLFLSFLISINGIVGLLMTGSRTGTLLILLTLLFLIIAKFKKYLNFSSVLEKIKVKKIFYILLSLIVLVMYLFFFQNEIFNYVYHLISRSLNFNFLNDPSSASRFKKLIISLEEVSHLAWLLGNGLRSKLIWYDGIFSMLMAHGGLLLILLLIIFYSFTIKSIIKCNANKKNSKILIFLISLYLLSNTITEHIMLSRNAFPVLVFLSTLYVTIKIKNNDNFL